MNSPKISVIIPVYNAEQYIAKCIRSVLEQTYTNLEIIVVDDGSSDESYKICSDLALNDSRIKFISQTNQGPSSARNTGLYIADGDYVTFVDADDWLEINAYETAVESIIKNKAEIVIWGYNSCSEEGKRANTDRIENGCYAGLEYQKLLKELIFCSGNNTVPLMYLWNRIISMKLIKENNIKFDDMVKRTEDLLFLIQVHFAASNTCIINDKKLYNYWTNPESITHTYTVGYWENIQRISAKMWKMIRLKKNAQLCRRMHYKDISLILRAIRNESFSEDRFLEKYKRLKMIMTSNMVKRSIRCVPSKNGVKHFGMSYRMLKTGIPIFSYLYVIYWKKRCNGI